MFITPYLGLEQLPGIVQDALSVAKTPQTRDMLLLSLVTQLSYALPRMRTYHGVPRHEYGPELMLMVLAAAASGKNVITRPRSLLRAIEGEQGHNVYIPANTSSAALLPLLKKFGGQGIMMATELDTLSQTLKTGYGQFSDVIRCLFEHETISQLRRTKNEFIVIRDPHVSMVLSGTLNQLTPFIRSRENGLMSRFMCYTVHGHQDFIDEVFDADAPKSDTEKEIETMYEAIAEHVGNLYLWMTSFDYKCFFVLSPEQRQTIKDFYRSEYDNYVTEYGEDFVPTLNRMPVIMKRIGMVLAGLRLDITKPMPSEIVCCDADFATMILLGHKLLMHAAMMYELLPNTNSQQVGVISQDFLQKQFFDLLGSEFTKADADKVAISIGLSVRTTERWLAHWAKNGKIRRIAHGTYQKQ